MLVSVNDTVHLSISRFTPSDCSPKPPLNVSKFLTLVCIEREFRLSEIPVFSNAKNYRQTATVPLVVPLVNPDHLNIIPTQRALQNLVRGFIVTNANCSTTGLVVPLHALEQAFGPIDKCMVTTMQAISGAGYPGVPSLDIFDNVVPYIADEEAKMESEASKILGKIVDNNQAFDCRYHNPIVISAACNRVPVLEGHTECVSVHFTRRPPPTPARVAEVLGAYTCDVQAEGCPSAPAQCITVHDDHDRPQPRLDRDFQYGAGVHVGRIRICPVLDIKFVIMSNNVAIGAATSSIINAEYAVLKGFLDTPMPEELLEENNT